MSSVSAGVGPGPRASRLGGFPRVLLRSVIATRFRRALATALAVAVVLGALAEPSHATLIASTTAGALALCLAFALTFIVAWKGAKVGSLNALALVGAAWSLMAAAQLATAVIAIDATGPMLPPRWVDWLRLAGYVAIALAIAREIWQSATPDSKVVLHLEAAIVAIVLSMGTLAAFSLSSRAHFDSLANTSTASSLVVLAWVVALGSSCAAVSARPDAQLWWAILAASWWLVGIASIGWAVDRLQGTVDLSVRTNWALLPAVLLTAGWTVDVVRSTARPPSIDSVAAADTNTVTVLEGSWIRALLPYVAIALLMALALGAREPSTGRLGSEIIPLLAVGAAVFILARQAFSHASQIRAARRLEEARVTLAMQAVVDPITGLPNRRALEDRLAEEVERALRYRQPLSVCFIDLDHFKRVNDEFGHPAGDEALRQVATILRRTARSIDFVGRYGGEEFVVLVPGTWSQDATVLGERLRRSVADDEASEWNGDRIRLTVSVGIAGLPEHARDGASLLGLADQALYAAKRAGRDRVVLYEPLRNDESGTLR
jgi:diguanylate cyclase (GGDEF)-like protein